MYEYLNEANIISYLLLIYIGIAALLYYMYLTSPARSISHMM